MNRTALVCCNFFLFFLVEFVLLQSVTKQSLLVFSKNPLNKRLAVVFDELKKINPSQLHKSKILELSNIQFNVKPSTGCTCAVNFMKTQKFKYSDISNRQGVKNVAIKNFAIKSKKKTVPKKIEITTTLVTHNIWNTKWFKRSSSFTNKNILTSVFKRNSINLKNGSQQICKKAKDFENNKLSQWNPFKKQIPLITEQKLYTKRLHHNLVFTRVKNLTTLIEKKDDRRKCNTRFKRDYPPSTDQQLEVINLNYISVESPCHNKLIKSNCNNVDQKQWVWSDKIQCENEKFVTSQIWQSVKVTRVQDQGVDLFYYACPTFSQTTLVCHMKQTNLNLRKATWDCRTLSDLPISPSLSHQPRLKCTNPLCRASLETSKEHKYKDPATSKHIKVTSPDPWIRDRTTESIHLKD